MPRRAKDWDGLHGWQKKDVENWNAVDFIEWFAECYQRAKGLPLRLNYGRDGGAMKQLLGFYTSPEATSCGPLSKQHIKDAIEWFTQHHDVLPIYRGQPTITNFCSTTWFPSIFNSSGDKQPKPPYQSRERLNQVEEVLDEFGSHYEDEFGLLYPVSDDERQLVTYRLHQLDRRKFDDPAYVLRSVTWWSIENWGTLVQKVDGRSVPYNAPLTLSRMLGDNMFEALLGYTLDEMRDEAL
jgi:hypothetical protein